MRGLTEVLIKSNISNVVRYTGANGQTENLLELIQMDQPFGSTVFFQNNNTLDRYFIRSLPNQIEFELRNRKTVLVSNNDFDYTIELLISYRD